MDTVLPFDWTPILNAATPFIIALLAGLTELMRRRLKHVEQKVNGLTDKLIAAKVLEAEAVGVAKEQLAQAGRDAAVIQALERQQSAKGSLPNNDAVKADTVLVDADTAHVTAPKKKP